MISCVHSCVTWSPPLQNIAAASLSSSFGRLVSSRIPGDRYCSSCPLSKLFFRPTRLPSMDLSFYNLSSIHCSSSKSSTSSSRCGQYHQNRRIELKRCRVIVQNGELRFRSAKETGELRFRSAKETYLEAESDMTETQLAATQTRRHVLIRSSCTVFAVANFLGGKKSALASISQRVRLKDVENQKLQDALRAAVAGDLENAETLFSELIKDEPASASGWSNRGSVRVSLGKFELATEDFTKAIELAPEAPVPYLNRAISYEALGLYDEAIADCKTAIENDPEEPAAWFNLGNVEARVNDFDKSLVAYERASNLAPGIAGYRLRQALVLFQVGRFEEAKKLMQGLVRKYPNYTEAHAALAAVLWREGQRSSAEEQFSEAINREPLYRKISWVTEELQWPPGVVQAFSKFLSID